MVVLQSTNSSSKIEGVTNLECDDEEDLFTKLLRRQRPLAAVLAPWLLW